MRPRHSLKRFLIASLLIAILLPILLIGAIFTNALTTSLKKNIIAGNESLSQSFVHQIETYLDQSLKDLLSLRTMIEEKNFETDHFNSLLESIRSNKDHFTKIQIIDQEGIVRFVSPFDPEFISIDLSNTPFYNHTIKTRTPFWSHTFISPQSNQPVVSITIPYIDGMITGYLSLSHLIDAAQKVSRGNSMLITITDQTSAYIVHYRDKMVFERGFDPLYDKLRKKYQGQIMTQQIHHEGQSMFATASMIKQTDWMIVFYQPTDKIFAPIYTVYFYMILAAAIIIFTATLLCLRHIKSIIRVLDKFTQSAEVMAHGHYNERITEIDYSEFSRLANQFNSMAGAVESRQRKLAENEEKYRSIFIAARDAILLIDVDTLQITDVNDFATCLYGYDGKHFLSLTLADICSEKDNTPTLLAAGKSWRSVNHHKRKDSSTFPVEVSGSYYSQAQGRQVCTLVVRDITDRILQEKQRQQMETQLSQAHKMEAIGTLAGGIAHDFNNILGAIIGFSELALSAAAENSKQKTHIKKIISAGKRAAELVKQILLFARSSDRQKKPVRINEIIREVSTLIRASIPTFIDIQVDIQSHANVMADPIELHQVMMNLCTNAWHAMKNNGGVLTITLTETQQLPKDVSDSLHKTASRYARLSVADTGHGMNEDIQQKIFDPYFTTKAVGDGSGMGLSVVQGIVRSIGGRINVTSELGKGTCFTIYLPLVDEIMDSQLGTPEGLKQGDETILVVDDEEMIAVPTARNLEALGYTPLAFTDATKALKMIEKNASSIDLVITDLTMPKLTGLQLAKKIKKIYPDMPIILASGYMEGISLEVAKSCGINAFISKPVTREDLSMKIRQVLDDA